MKDITCGLRLQELIENVETTSPPFILQMGTMKTRGEMGLPETPNALGRSCWLQQGPGLCVLSPGCAQGYQVGSLKLVTVGVSAMETGKHYKSQWLLPHKTGPPAHH